MEIKKNKIEELVKILDELKLTELSYSDGKTSIKVGKSSIVTPNVIGQNISSASLAVRSWPPPPPLVCFLPCFFCLFPDYLDSAGKCTCAIHSSVWEAGVSRKDRTSYRNP